MRGSGSRFEGRRLVKPIGLAAVVLTWLGVSAVLPDWFLTLPLVAQEAYAQRFLWAVLALYWAALIPAVVGGATLTVVVVRAHRAGAGRPVAARLLLLCASTMIGLAILEAAGAAWLAWAHRFPALPTRFLDAPGDELRITVIGGSSRQGAALPGVALDRPDRRLEAPVALPGRRVVADVMAREGATLEEMHLKLGRVRYRPDILILFAGHNEYQARFVWDQDGDVAVGLLPYLLKVVMGDGLGSPFFGMISEASSKYRLMVPPHMAGRGPVEPPIIRHSESERLRREFRRRIEAIVSWCERIGTLPVLVIPADNEAGFEPNRSVLPESLLEARRAFARDWLSACAAESGSDPAAAMSRYRELIDRQPGFAEAHFRLGRLLERSGRFDEAAAQYRLARDLDGFPQRCPSPFQDAYREVAARHGCILIDGPAELRALSPHGLLDDRVFHDAHHPSLRGHIALAEAVLHELLPPRRFGWTDGVVPSIDLAECDLALRHG